jgi:tRNA pseudouridine38-40 synthase
MITNEESPFSSLSYNFERIQTKRGSRPVPPPNYRNLRLEISYDGTAFFGYQYQPEHKNVQEVLTNAWKTLAREQVLLFGCSRLDAGVSASHFVLNLYTQCKLDTDRIVRGLNGILQTVFQAPICIYSCTDMPAMFHARYDTVGKHYRYMIWHGRGFHALLTPHCWNVRSTQSPENLSSILSEFQGFHNFSAFRAQGCQSSTTDRTIHRTDCWQHPRHPELTVFDFWGDGFLKNMIRNIVGTAVDISTKKIPQNTVQQAFLHGDRQKIGQCAPGYALTLEQVYYCPEKYRADYTAGIRQFFS